MSRQYDPELDDILQDAELMHVADLLRAGRMSDPPLDDAFRSALRRQLMNRAWGMGDGGVHRWQKVFGPVGLAWAGAAVGVILIAAVVFAINSSPGELTRQVLVTSPISGGTAVLLQQPILVNFNQAMDHPSTEAAVQITPATTVAFSWNSNTLAVLPTSGNLAPNTQYQVTIGPTAKTAAGQELAGPKTITFVTQAPPPPAPSPTPVTSPSATPPHGLITTTRQLAAGPGITNIAWSPDSSTVFFIGGKGELESVKAAAGNSTVLVADGVTSAVLSPAGDHIAYVRNRKVEVLALTTPATVEIVPTSTPLVTGWTKDGVEWASADGVYLQGADGPSKVAPLPANGAVKPLSFSPDGGHLAYTQDQSLQVLDVATGKSSTLGIAGAQLLGWSPDGTGVMYSGAQAVVVADVAGRTLANLPTGEPSWSSQDEVLLGSDTDLFQVRPDGSSLTKLADGTYHLPVWAPNGTSFTYFRGSALFSATAPAPPAKSPALDAAAAIVNTFMQARKAGQSEKALSLLDDNGKKAYSSSTGGLNLIVTGDPSFSRYYVLTQEITGTQPDTARFVVRIVLAHEMLDVSTYEETLTLVRTQGSGQFMVDQAMAGQQLTLGKSASVVSVDVSSTSVRITFDSDLQPDTVREGVILLDGKGKQIGEAPRYSSKTVTISGLDLKAGATYKLVVLPTVRDVSGNNITAEYDLTFVGPGDSHGDKQNEHGASPSPHATPSAPSS